MREKLPQNKCQVKAILKLKDDIKIFTIYKVFLLTDEILKQSKALTIPMVLIFVSQQIFQTHTKNFFHFVLTLVKLLRSFQKHSQDGH